MPLAFCLVAFSGQLQHNHRDNLLLPGFIFNHKFINLIQMTLPFEYLLLQALATCAGYGTCARDQMDL